LNSEDQLKTLVQVALTHPMSLQLLREVYIKDCRFSEKLLDDTDYDEYDELEVEDWLNTSFKVNSDPPYIFSEAIIKQFTISSTFTS
jgi:hypothetical protein